MTAFRPALTALIVAGALVSLPTLAQAAKFYKWVDAQGVTHYTEKAPANAKTTAVKVGDTTSSDAEDDIKQLEARRAALAADKKKAAEAAAKTPTESNANTSKQQAENCEIHRKNLAVLKTGGRITTKDDNGEPHHLSPEEIQKQITASENAITQCEASAASASPTR